MRAAVIVAASVTALAWPERASAQFTRHTYDITRYELEIRPDFSSGDLRVSALVRIDNPEREPVFRFGLSDQFDEVSALVDGRQTPIRRSDGIVEIDSPEKTRDIRVRFELHGKNLQSEDEKRAAIERDSLFLLWSDRFYPIDFVDWAAVKISVQMPRGLQAWRVVAPGTPQTIREEKEVAWHVFETSRPTVAFSVFADRRWLLTERTVRGLRMQTLLHPDVSRLAEEVLRSSADVLSFYTDLHGFYPADAFSFITIAGMFARRAFPGVVGYTPAYLEKTMAADGYDGHETALLWWGYGVRGEGPGAFQWTEGFGDYVEIMYTEARGKPLPSNLERARDAYLALPEGSNIPLTDLRGNTPQPLVHGRLPWMMDAHRKCVGDSSFRQAIRTLFEQYRYRTFTLDEFLGVMGGEQRANECGSFSRGR